jgi:hypothetical protein
VFALPAPVGNWNINFFIFVSERDKEVMMATVEIKKVSPLELAEKRLEVVHRLLYQFGHFLEPEKRDLYEFSWNEITEVLTAEKSVSLSRVNSLFVSVKKEITLARVKRLRDSVSDLVDVYLQYEELFTNTNAYEVSNDWLKGASSGDYRIVKLWLDDGWKILTNDLKAPWGRCKKCGTPIRPKRVGPEGKKAWKIFDLCGGCHHDEKVAKEDLVEATKGVQHHKVEKPGSAAKHGHGHPVNENIRPLDRKKGKKTGA